MGAPLDFTRLSDVLRGSTSSESDFLGQFRRATDLDAEQLLQAAGNDQFARVAQLAHRIEGASKVVGARPLADACAGLAAACARLAASAGPGAPAGLLLALDAFIERKQALYAFLDTPMRAPAMTGTLPENSQKIVAPQICSGLRFLVVDDHEFQRNLVARLLGQLGAGEVRTFPDGAAALVAARTLPAPAIVVLDLAMPGPSGIDVVRIVAQEKLPVAVIIHSALCEESLREPLRLARSFGASVLGCVSKPLTSAKLAPLLADQRPAAKPGTPGLARAS